jgi:A/G-specific adenine glycosylase
VDRSPRGSRAVRLAPIPPPLDSPTDSRFVDSVRNELLAWFESEKRSLPWRGSADAYRIWVSEVMLQQTTVRAVLRRFDGFVRRFPNVASLAKATEDDVLAAWSGLGYYARARNLRKAAREIVERHRGEIPPEPAELRRLPGFGEYMSSAVASLAFGARLPAADANVERVLSRLFGIHGTAGSALLRRRVLDVARALLPADRPGDATAALMDLGQTVCKPRRPECPICPVAAGCHARRTGPPEAFPRRARRPPTVRLSLAAAIAERNGRVLLVRRRASWLDGLWEFPSAVDPLPDGARRALDRELRRLGFALTRSAPVGRARHTVVNRRLEIDVFRAASGGARAVATDRERRWFRREELDSAAVPTLTRKIAAAGLGPG